MMILAVASGGGHFVQLKKILFYFESEVLTVYSTMENPSLNLNCKYQVIPDCNIYNFYGLFRCFMSLFCKIYILRPKVVISTGAAPGFLALLVGKILGAKTIWIDSIANSEKLSLSGRMARFVADKWYTQWPELSSENGPYYIGSVL